jgi:hypothetical protein
MGSAKFRSDGRELVRERRLARMRRNDERRQARELKRSQLAAMPVALSAAQRLAEDEVQADVAQIVAEALERHDHQLAGVFGAGRPDWSAAAAEQPAVASEAVAVDECVPPRPLVREPRVSGRDRDIAEFRERRQAVASEARREARARVVRQGEPAAVADALAAIRDASADTWRREREALEGALGSERIAEVGQAARAGLRSVSRDAARTSRRSGRDPELAAAVCVCYAILAKLPRTALRSQQRANPRPRERASSRRAFWR